MWSLMKWKSTEIAIDYDVEKEVMCKLLLHLEMWNI